MWVTLQNNAGWDCFQDSVFAGDLEDSKSPSGGTFCVFGSHTFVPISWMCKKQTSVSHSSTESEMISLDAGSRLHGDSRSRLMESDRHSSWKRESESFTQFKNASNLME